MYFITTKRMLEVCFSAHPNIQYRTLFAFWRAWFWNRYPGLTAGAYVFAGQLKKAVAFDRSAP